ncbi:VWA domain-containing protein [Nocardia sp. NPDC050712]|uniref:VWA domain-containing protein n=1 Tax=Nocardia sp. NPDC050712 TaxID=3155518 RepID=UPI0033CDB6DA
MSSLENQGISVAVDQNEYLAEGADTVDAIVTVEAGADFVAAEPPPERVEILIIDCSGSMATGRKFQGAREATLAAIDVLPEGTRFAIIEGTAKARLIFPKDEPSLPATRANVAAARRQLDKLRPSGGTAMGTWLGLARQLAKKHEGAMVHAILLTDGKNEHEEPETLAAEIKLSEGLFTCDCRGVGADYVVKEMQLISNALHGGTDVVKDAEHLAADFQAMMATSLAKAIPELTLRVWTPAGAVVNYVKQVAPAIVDLTGLQSENSPQVRDFPLGSWGAEEREYHLQVRVEPAAPGREKAAARVTVFAGEQEVGKGLVRAVWTEDTELSARISERVAKYTDQAELAQVVQEGLDARKQGDVDTATAKLRRAVELATQAGNVETAKLLRNVVEVDEHDGTVRLRAKVEAFDEKALEARSVKTVRIPPKKS